MAGTTTTPAVIATPEGSQSVASINANRAAAVAAGQNPYSIASGGATNTSQGAGLGMTPVITSNAATSDLNTNVAPSVDAVNAAITAQNQKLAADKATADAKAQADAIAQQQQQAAQAKATLDAQNAATKAAALAAANAGTGGGSTDGSKTETPTPAPKNVQPYADANGANPNNWQTVTNQDGSVVTATKNSDGTYTPVDANTLAIGNAQAQLAQTNQQYQDAYTQFANTTNAIINGTVPLSAGEQAQVSSLQQQYQALIQQQTLSNTSMQGIANIRGYQTGAAEYDPTFQQKTIGSIVQGGLNKIADLNTKMAGAVATLTDTLKNNDLANIKAQFDELQTFTQNRQTQLQNTITTAQTAIKNAQDEAEQATKDQLAALVEQDTVSYHDKQIAIQQATLDEKTRVDLQNGALGGAATTSGQLPAVTMTAANVPDPTAQTTFLAALPLDVATLVKGLADYTINPNSSPQKQYKGSSALSQAQMLSLVKQYDPSYDEAQYASRAAYLKNLQSGPLSQGVISANKTIAHLDTFANSVSDILYNKNSFSNVSNAVGAFINEPGNTQLQSQLNEASTEANGLKDEFAKFFKGTGATDVNSINSWGNQLDIHATPGQLHGTVQGALNLFAGQLDTLNQQYTSTMGQAPNTNQILQPATITKLSDFKNQGYDVDIPGVLYAVTPNYSVDQAKAAYLKYGGQDAQANLTSAAAQLQAAGLPVTPENILQLAQEQ